MTLLARVGGRLLRPVNALLDPLERRMCADGPGHPRPVFILGAPRSGTTLFYQALTVGRDFGYLSNRHCRWYGAPLLVERRLGRGARSGPAGDFSSDRGLTRGGTGAAECARFWYRWFPRTPHRLTPAEVPAEAQRSLRSVVGALCEVRQAPFLFKVLTHSLRVELLATLFPEARFLVLHRPTLWTAQSILQARVRTSGDAGRWWSVEPPGHEEWLTRAPEEQTVWQVQQTYEWIAADARTVGSERFLHLDYADLCADPASTLARVDAFLARAGLAAPVRDLLPGSFPHRDAPQLPAESFAVLKRVAATAPEQAR